MTQSRLFRSRTERRIAGVCGGIAETTGVDPVFIRLAAVGLALVAPPVGLVGYLASWIIIPERDVSPAGSAAGATYEPPGSPAGADAVPGETTGASGGAAAGATAPAAGGTGPWSQWHQGDGSLIGGALFVGIGLFFLLMNLGILDWEMFRFWRWRFVWPMVVIALGVLMLARAVRGRNQWLPR